MPHEIDKETLSAFLDGELDAPKREELSRHLASCPECSAYLERLKAASADFKAYGAQKAPAALSASALNPRQAPAHAPRPMLKLAWALALAAVLLASGSVMVRRFMPGLFNQISGMISGASGNLGK